MNEVGTFNIDSLKTPTNKTINVVFSPSNNVKTFTTEIYKNNQKTIQTDRTDISLIETGTYKIKIVATLIDGRQKTIESGEYIIDKESPTISVKKDIITVDKNNIKKVKEYAKAVDNYDKEVELKVSDINLEKKVQTIKYTALDTAGNMTEKYVKLELQNRNVFFAVYGIILVIILLILYLISKYKRALNIENRLEPFIIKPVKDNSLSISEKLINKYQKLTRKITKNFDKSPLALKYSKKLEKYLPVTNIHKTKEDIFAGKIITGFIFTLVALISKIFTFKIISGYEIVLVYTFGFFALDILYFIKYKIFRWKIESDFIAAITIMNNSFKSGRSITQSIDTVAEELKGYVGEEFKRMSIELLYGLEIDVVFERFAKRIGLEEANYLTASLTILNKTGGDIIKVFNSIERNMFDKRKLKLELSSLTSGSRIVVATLLGMPFFFALVISMINKDYFVPLFTTQIGRILLIFMIIYYIIFVVVVRKIMKVVIWWKTSWIKSIVKKL